MRRLNIPLWLGYLIGIFMLTVTVVFCRFYPELSLEAERVSQELSDSPPQGVCFNEIWLVVNTLTPIGRYGIPLIALVATLFAGWGSSIAKRLDIDNIRHPLIPSSIAIASPWILMVAGVACTVITWNLL